MEIKKTITSIFVVPTLKISSDSLKKNGFINGYISDELAELIYPDSVCVLFRPPDVYRFREFLESEYERGDVLDDYDYEEGYVVIVYKLNKKFKKDFELIKQGKYSKTSLAFQKLFPRVVKIVKKGLRRDEISLQFRIFNKTTDLVEYWENKFDVTFDPEFEVWDNFYDSNEILNIEKIKQEHAE